MQNVQPPYLRNLRHHPAVRESASAAVLHTSSLDPFDQLDQDLPDSEILLLQHLLLALRGLELVSSKKYMILEIFSIIHPDFITCLEAGKLIFHEMNAWKFIQKNNKKIKKTKEIKAKTKIKSFFK